MKFSIITPSYRNSEWLKLCIASVADQGVELEHLVQDGRSDDGTLDWLTSDQRVQAIVETDTGMYDAINRGLKRARGEIIAHLNCDEQYLPGALRAVEEFFLANPGVDVVFADAVAVNGDGEYLWHRKMVRPLLWHTWTAHLATLTCATFFRRSIIDQRGVFFDPNWRYVGDGVFMLRLLREGVPMAVLRRFTSVFTLTGQNLSREAKAREETLRYYETAPRIARRLRPLTQAHHFLRRLLSGTYAQREFDFQLYTRGSPTERVSRHVSRPTSRWRW